jgi:crotonobetainyl-CoA:carnitine CoA-transferase CaiB-like acyl-CoA transferase
MSAPLAGIKVVEVSMWAFVPSAGAMLADMGADVIKIEPHAGDPVRGLAMAGIKPGTGGFTFMYEIWNRGKRSVTLDIAAEGALDVLHRLLEDADVFLTSLLPAARRKLGIDVEALTTRFPKLIYAVGSGQGVHGPDAEKGGYDSISFWSRSGIVSAVTPDDVAYPLNMPGGAFGDSMSGSMLAGGVAAAIAQRALTGKASVVDVSLLNAGMWVLQPGIVAASLLGTDVSSRSACCRGSVIGRGCVKPSAIPNWPKTRALPPMPCAPRILPNVSGCWMAFLRPGRWPRGSRCCSAKTANGMSSRKRASWSRTQTRSPTATSRMSIMAMVAASRWSARR